jgi:hypothetical protein
MFQNSLFRSPIDLVSPIVEIEEKPKTARYHRAVRVMGGSGPVPNRLPIDFRENNHQWGQ